MNKILLAIKLIFCWIQNLLFIIKISDGKVSKVKGNVKNGFMIDCIDIAKRNVLKFGLLYGVRGPFGRPILKATNDISKDTLQQLRNSWNYNS